VLSLQEQQHAGSQADVPATLPVRLLLLLPLLQQHLHVLLLLVLLMLLQQI
jgi:hypothetical protein